MVQETVKFLIQNERTFEILHKLYFTWKKVQKAVEPLTKNEKRCYTGIQIAGGVINETKAVNTFEHSLFNMIEKRSKKHEA